jgi:hypothetical protein
MIEMLLQLAEHLLDAIIGLLVGIGFVTAGFALYDLFNS